MDKLGEVFNFISQFFRWYFIVMPWEQAVFVRAGNKHRVLDKGMYFKIPFLDRVYIQTKRMRIVDMPIQTLTTADGKTITIKAGIKYRIVDMFKLYNGLFHPENTLLIMVMNNIADYIQGNKLEDITPAKIMAQCDISAQTTEWGLADVEVKIHTYAVVRTFRLIQDNTIFYREQLKMHHSDEKIET